MDPMDPMEETLYEVAVLEKTKDGRVVLVVAPMPVIARDEEDAKFALLERTDLAGEMARAMPRDRRRILCRPF